MLSQAGNVNKFVAWTLYAGVSAWSTVFVLVQFVLGYCHCLTFCPVILLANESEAETMFT